MKAKKFNEFLNEANNMKTLKGFLKEIRKEYGPTPTPQSVADFIYNNYEEVTGERLEDSDPESNDHIADIIAYFKFDIDEWMVAWTDRTNESVNEKVKLIMRNILSKMVPAAFGPTTNHKMREEIRIAVEDAITPILKKYDYVVESEDVLEEGVIQNLNSDDFDGADPKTIDVHNQGVGGVRSLQGHRDQVVRLLEEMLKEAKKAQKNHKMAHWHIDKVLGLADPQKMGGVLLPYLKNHQAAVEELESIRKRGGSGKNKTIPKGLI